MSKKLVVEELFRPARKNFPRRNVVQKGIDDTWQMDLIEMGKYSKQIGGYKYILTAIDIFSKFAWVYPLKTKTGKEVANAFVQILKNGRQPLNLQTDQGKEFFNKIFKKITENRNINHYFTYSSKKASIVERFNRTLKSLLYKRFALNNNNKWKSILPDTVEFYNSKYHRTIKMRPSDVNDTNEALILRRYHIQQSRPLEMRKCKFKVGDFVRISKFKSVFDRGFNMNWTTEIFRIKKVQDTSPKTFLLEDLKGEPILGGFYQYELQKTKQPDVYLIEKILKQKGQKVYVKWLGLPSSNNSWINKQNCITN